MFDPAKTMERVRALGANVLVDGGRLKIVNGRKLPQEATDYIKANAAAIADWLDREAQFDERAGIMQFDGGLTRPAAEYFSRLLQSSPPPGADPADWSWHISQFAAVIDAALPRAA